MLTLKILATVFACLGGVIAIGQVVVGFGHWDPEWRVTEAIVVYGLRYVFALILGRFPLVVAATALATLVVLGLLRLDVPVLGLRLPGWWATAIDGLVALVATCAVAWWLRLLEARYAIWIVASAALALATSVYLVPSAVAWALAIIAALLLCAPLLGVIVAAVSVDVYHLTERLLKSRASATAVSVLLLLASTLIQIWVISSRT